MVVGCQQAQQGLGCTAVGVMEYGVADWEVWLLLAGYGRGSTVNSDECPSYCDYPDVGVWAVWQIDLDTTWQESGALPWVV